VEGGFPGMENNIIARLAPKSKADVKTWRKGEKIKQDMIIKAFSQTSSEEVDIICQERTKGDTQIGGKDGTN